MKQQIEEKNKLLEDAYIALDSIEQEKEMFQQELEILRDRDDNGR